MKTIDHFSEERRQKIAEMLKEYGRVTVKELCSLFSVTSVTVRTDLNALEKAGQLVRTFGGAILPPSTTAEPPFQFRTKVRSEAKQRLAQAAAALICDGEAVYIDGGTTAASMRYFLKDKKDITVITPSIEVAYYLYEVPAIKIFVMGGFMKRESCSTLGVSSAGTVVKWIIRKAFYGAYGFTINHGLTDVDSGLIEQKRFVAERAQVNIGLIDSTKWGRVSLDSFVQTKDIDMIITDSKAPEDQVAAAREQGIEVILT
jgi:DeoR/GlpR family transcriptional regulator of sugar metabolism